MNVKQTSKAYPNTVLQESMRAHGVPCRVMWEIPGPEHTQIAWLTSYALDNQICVIVATYVNGNGWDVHVPVLIRDVPACVRRVLELCNVKPRES